jgi:hypothetical protein
MTNVRESWNSGGNQVSISIMEELNVDRLTLLLSFQRSAGQSLVILTLVLTSLQELSPRLLSFFNPGHYMNSSLFDFLNNQ